MCMKMRTLITISSLLLICSCSENRIDQPKSFAGPTQSEMHLLYLSAEQGNLRAIERLSDISALEGRARDARLWQQIAVDLGEPRHTSGLTNAFKMGAEEATDEVAQRIFLSAATWDRRVSDNTQAAK